MTEIYVDILPVLCDLYHVLTVLIYDIVRF